MTRRIPQVGDVVVILSPPRDFIDHGPVVPHHDVEDGALGEVVRIGWKGFFDVQHGKSEVWHVWTYAAAQLCVVGDVR